MRISYDNSEKYDDQGKNALVLSLIFSSYVTTIESLAGAFFLIGIIKGKMVKKSVLRTGAHTLAVGGIAAFVAYVVGYLLSLAVR